MQILSSQKFFFFSILYRQGSDSPYRRTKRKDSRQLVCKGVLRFVCLMSSRQLLETLFCRSSQGIYALLNIYFVTYYLMTRIRTLNSAKLKFIQNAYKRREHDRLATHFRQPLVSGSRVIRSCRMYTRCSFHVDFSCNFFCFLYLAKKPSEI